MNVIRETVRVAKEEIESKPETYDKYYKFTKHTGFDKDKIGQTVIAEFLGGPWKVTGSSFFCID